VLLRSRSLLLSTAAHANHKLLGRIHERLTKPVVYAGHSEQARHERLRVLREAIEKPGFEREVESLLRMADAKSRPARLRFRQASGGGAAGEGCGRMQTWPMRPEPVQLRGLPGGGIAERRQRPPGSYSRLG
jgi:hypothetical protein